MIRHACHRAWNVERFAQSMQHRRLRSTRPRRALTLVEVLMASALVGLVLIGALNLLGLSARRNLEGTHRLQALRLAEDLMGEILQQQYAEEQSVAVFGVEVGEVAGSSGPRTSFDDVDDYHGWDASPPQARDGTPLFNTKEWRRWVVVQCVDPSNLARPLSNSDDKGVKRIEVRVSYQGQTLASLTGFQTRNWIDMIPEPDNDHTTGSLPPVNQGPLAVARANPSSGTGSVTVAFDATGSHDPDGDPLSYQWDFGDGTTGYGSRPSHTYTNNSGITIVRTATLTATDPDGAQGTDTVVITVYGK